MQNFLFTGDIFKGSRYEKGHPLDMDRVWPSVELIQLMGWIDNEQIIKNDPAEINELIKFHDLDYVQALKKAEENQHLPENLKRKFNIGIGNNPIFREVFSRPATAARASIRAVEMISNKKAKKILTVDNIRKNSSLSAICSQTVRNRKKYVFYFFVGNQKLH